MRYLLDTDWAVDVLRRSHASRQIRGRIDELMPLGIAISVISLAELSVGPHLVGDTADRRAEMLDFVAQFALIPVDQETCEMFGQIEARLRQQGQPIGRFDTLIAATALQHDLTLLTNNRRHFERIDGLQIESV